MKQLFFRIIYSPAVNFCLRNITKYLFFWLPRSYKLPPSGTIRIHLEGKTIKMKTNQTNYLTYCAFWEGAENFEYTSVFIKLIKKVNSFYDIGTNIGFYSLLAARLNPAIQVRSFEPARGPLHFLKENVKLNKLTNISVEPIALADKEGEIDFYEVRSQKYNFVEYNLAGEGNAGSKTGSDMFVKSTVKCTTLDAYNADHASEQVDLMKMDTEGTEHYILAKAGEVLNRTKPIVICETLFNAIEPELETIFRSYGYEFFNHYPEGLKKTNSIKRTTDNGVRNCFFVHPSKYELIKEFVVE